MAANLADQKCIPCRGGTPPLTHDQIVPLQEQLDGWLVEADKKLIKSFKFKNWLQAVDFVNRISPLAEPENPHPDLYVPWGEVRVHLLTHKINRLTESAFYLAANIDRAFVPACS